MSLTVEETANLVVTFGGESKNTGSTEVQIALLTAKINQLQQHFSVHSRVLTDLWMLELSITTT